MNFKNKVFSKRRVILYSFFISAFCFVVNENGIANSEYKVGDTRVFENNDFVINTSSAIGFNDEILQVPDSIKKIQNKIISLTALIEEEGRFIDRLDQLYQVTYPIGISKNIAGQNYTIVLDSDEITPEGAFINAYMSFPVPQTGRQLAFAANRIPLSAEGGINGVIELALLADEPINFGQNARLIIYGCDEQLKECRTKVRFDCNGFIDMVIDAGIEFSKDAFICENPETGEQKPNEPVTANFKTTIQSWNDLIVDISLPPFQVSGFKGFGFEVQNATFDFSDINNPAGIVFPENYAGLEVYGDLPELWQGFYCRQATLRLPPELHNGERMEILAQNVVIDDMGFSGTFAMNNLLPLENGSIGGWAFSVDHIEVNLVANNVTKGALKGKITMPIMDSTDYMDYSAFVDQSGDFQFTASMPRSFKVPLFVAEMKVYETSTLTIQRENKKFEVLATLNGEINVNAPISDNSKGSKGFKVDDLKFENMQIGSMAPYFRPGIWSVGEIGYSSMNGFSISLTNVESFDENKDVGLKFTATVKLSGEKYVASTTLKIMGTRYSTTEEGDVVKHKLKYKKIELQDLYISVTDAPISLEGYLAIFRDDETYGDGYAGMINASIVDKIGIKATAVFGEVDGFKYWYADALANLSASPIPIFTGVSLYGIGGGAYYHMSQKEREGIPFADANIEKAKDVINYIPDKTVFLGFKATVAIGTSSPRGFNSIATFEIAFNQGGGIREAMFYGEASVMSTMDFNSPTIDAPVWATAFIGLDFENNSFHGNFKVYVDAVGGMLTGIGPGNLAGEMVVHADPSDWYVHIGKPSARLGVELEIFGFSIENGSYFMMGTKIEEMPPPPEAVLRILQMPIPENRNTEELMSAKGLAFGTFIGFDSGKQKFLIFYAQFAMGVGFDVMLSDKGETYCVETGQKIGINGWYAEGQLYAYMQGSIGIDIKVFGIKIHEEILDIGAAILLEAKLPNPFWMRGTVGGYYSLLGGRIKSTCRFQLELGNQCTLMTLQQKTDPLEGLSVISELSPGEGRNAVDVFTTPQVVFNYQVGQPFKISDSVSNKTQYKVVLDHFKVLENNQQVTGTYEWNDEADVLVFNPRDILPGNTPMKLEAKVHFEYSVNGGWEVVKYEGKETTEEMTAEFETGEAPDYIPESNIAHSYPLKDMMNLYKNEFSTGYVQLNWGQEYLFNVSDEWLQFGRFTPVAGGEPVYINFSYNESKKKINHIIPANLSPNTIYLFEIINLPAKASGAVDANIVSKAQKKSVGNEDVTMTAKEAETERSDLQEKVIFTRYFRTSMFNSLSEKINAITNDITGSYNSGYSPVVFNINSKISIPEPFDKYEIMGNDDMEPLLELWASTGGKWLKELQIPFIYADYPITEYAIVRNRDTVQYGLIPVRNVYLDTYTQPFRLLSDEEKGRGQTSFVSDVNTYLNYNLSTTTWHDYRDIASMLATQNISHPRKTELITKNYPGIIINTTYPVNVRYRLPYINKTGTGNTITINY